MAVLSPTQVPLRATIAGFRRFSVSEYHKLIAMGVLTEDDHVELLEGYLVNKMARNPPHDGAIDLVNYALARLMPAGWLLRIQEALTLPESEPEPDFAVVQGTPRSFLQRHPTEKEVDLVIEIADSSLDSDRSDKARIYARSGITQYWIVNLVDRQIEVMTDPNSIGMPPDYVTQTVLKPGSDIELIIRKTSIARLAVSDLLP